MPLFSVIIPTLNESKMIGSCIQHVMDAAIESDVEIVVVDGGSTDNTVSISESFGVHVIQFQRGRAKQCNRGGCVAKGEVLLFLHADILMPLNAFTYLEQKLLDPEVSAGTFLTKYIEEHWWLRVHDRYSHVKSVFTTFGDQCITLKKSLFNELGGFPEKELFDDVALLQLIRKRVTIHTFTPVLSISARRFIDNGIIRHSIFNFIILMMYLVGVSTSWMAKFYYHHSPESAIINATADN